MDFLPRWFATYGSNPLYEIEARVKDVDEATFNSLLAKLRSAYPGEATCKVDESEKRTRVRKTYDAAARPGAPAAATFMKKQQIETVDKDVDGVYVRFSLTMEEPVAAPAAFAPNYLRIKDRVTFRVDGEVAYELTRVRSGGSRAEAEAAGVETEVELEWCGHAVFGDATPEWWAKNFEYKVGFAVRHVLAGK